MLKCRTKYQIENYRPGVCTPRSYALAAPVSVLCEICGKTVHRNLSRINRNKHQYCSRKCCYAGRSRKVEVKCGACGKTIQRRPEHSMRHENHFCNSKCFGKTMLGTKKIISTEELQVRYAKRRRKANAQKRFEISFLSDHYIKQLLTKGSPIGYRDIPSELVEVKRTQIQLYRELKGL